MKVKVSHSVMSDSYATSWTVAHQAPLSTEFSRQEYWSGLPFPSPGDLPNSGIEPRSPALQADSLATELQGKSLQLWTIQMHLDNRGGLSNLFMLLSPLLMHSTIRARFYSFDL